ncbi:phage holin family protein [Phragmitibacter flavus]|uniref:Phage holin family protein n=1 Tax=Phragmitibacter flavus TaxID=2576071 RepID=A0A5R8K9L7_9BACT|nr:phage holin family protein [Phragmitibacter flavus]TLD69032.1 phage holin family protein [Phragmitibacter flavus]
MEPAAPASAPSTPPMAMGGISATLLRYIEARGLLLSIETQEALQILLRVVIFTILGSIIALTGWLLLTAGLAALIIEQTGWSPLKAIFILAGAQLVLALICFLVALARIKSALWFADSINELQKDRTWLANQTKKS